MSFKTQRMPRLRVTVDAWSAIPDSVLIECVFPYATFEDGSALRLTCKAFLLGTKETSFHDKKWVGCVEDWNTCFPMAKHLRLYNPRLETCEVVLPHLETLIADSMFVEYATSLLANTNRLKSVVLASVWSFTVDEMMALTGLISEIPHVAFVNTGLTDAGIRQLQGVQDLEYSMWGNFRDFRSIGHLTGLRKLKLSFDGCMSDETFAVLKDLRLEELRVEGKGEDGEDEPMSDQAFFDMAKIPKIELESEYLHHYLSGVTPMGLKALGGHQTVKRRCARINMGYRFVRIEGVDNSAELWDSMHSF